MNITNWSKSLSALIKKMPNGYEAIVGYGFIDIRPEGTLDKHHMSGFDGFGIQEAPIESILNTYRIIPFSEGT